MLCFLNRIKDKSIINEAAIWINVGNLQKNCLPIHQACYSKPPARVIASLLRAYRDGAQKTSNHAMTPLHIACQSGACAEVVQLLVDAYPAAVKQVDKFDMLPLHVACIESARLEVVDIVVKFNPRGIYMKDKAGYSPLEYAKMSQNPGSCKIERFLESVQEDTLIVKSRGGNEEKEDLTVSGGNHSGKNCCNDDCQGVSLLQKLSGNDPYFSTDIYCANDPRKNDRGLQYRCCLEKLSEMHAVQEAKDDEKIEVYTPKSCDLYFLVSCRKWKLVIAKLRKDVYEEYSMSYQSTISGRASDGNLEAFTWVRDDFLNRIYLPLHKACTLHPNLSVISSLIAVHPESVKSLDVIENMLPIHLACKYNASPDIIECLIDVYPECVEIKNARGELPLHLACQSHNTMLKTFELLLKKFPESINHNSAQSLSPVETVLKGRNPEKREIVALLRTAQEMLRDLHQKIELKK